MNSFQGREGGELVPSSEPDWFEQSFDDFYLRLYVHRGEAEAERLARTLRSRYALEGPVLDLACGAGRFLHVLHRMGVRVAGSDLSLPLLRRARSQWAESAPVLARADMRSLPFARGSFAWVILLFTSFGYFRQKEEDVRALREIARVLAPGGRLLLDYLNAKRTVAELVPHSTRLVEGHWVREVRWVDSEGPFLRKHIYLDGETKAPSYEERVRLYQPSDLIALFAAEGWGPLETLGDYDGSTFDESRSPRFLLLARRPGEIAP